jgi:hypothetical protein
VVKKKDVNTAAGLTQGPTVKSEGNELSKPYRYLKVSDIPITGDYELAQWDLVVRGVLDWAGTLPDTFGTNEHPELLDTVQALWDKCLPERIEDVQNNPAVKKVVRLQVSTVTIMLTDAIVLRSSTVSMNGKAHSERRRSLYLVTMSRTTLYSEGIQAKSQLWLACCCPIRMNNLMYSHLYIPIRRYVFPSSFVSQGS